MVVLFCEEKKKRTDPGKWTANFAVHSWTGRGSERGDDRSGDGFRDRRARDKRIKPCDPKPLLPTGEKTAESLMGKGVWEEMKGGKDVTHGKGQVGEGLENKGIQLSGG